MFFVHWSSTDSSYVDMERRDGTCRRCGETCRHTIRYHVTKTRHYSVVSLGPGDKALSVICHGCLLEQQVPDGDAGPLIAEYDAQLAAAEAGRMIDEGRPQKAEKRLRKLLRKSPGHPHARYMMARCLAAQLRHGEAEEYVRGLEADYPDDESVAGLRACLPGPRGALG